MRRQKPPPRGQQVASSASELPFGGSENSRVIMMKPQFPYTHTKEEKSQDLLQMPETGGGGSGDVHNEPGRGSLLSQGRSEWEIESRVASPYYL